MRGFFEELRHRNVFRVAIAYAVVGWLLAQIADLVVDAFNLPEQFLQMLIVLLLLGFPLAVILAWAFELTPDGLKRAREVPTDAPKDPRSGKFLNRLTIVTLIIAVAWLGWDKLQRSDGGPTTDTLKADKSIAVLPFADFSPDGEHAWFADGLTDEILNALARTRDLRVASRTSSFQYRNTDGDLPRIATELGVAHILEGSVRRSGDRLRVTAQLIRAADDTHLWSDTFDGTTADSIAIQERIALRIANALETAMDPEELERMLSAGTDSVEAWELYLQAMALARSDHASFGEVLRLLEQAVDLDPGFVDAHLSIASGWLAHLNPSLGGRFEGEISDDEARQRFYDAIELAQDHARSDVMRTEYQALRARFDIRLLDFLDASRRLAESWPERVEYIAQLMNAQILVGDYEGARATGLGAKTWVMEQNQTPADIFQYLHRVDVPAALEMAEAAISAPNASAQTLYQAHRVFLYAGRIEEAARLATLHNARSSDVSSVAMVDVRQACAENRAAAANRIYEDFLASAPSTGIVADNRWLFLQTLGRYDEAVEAVRFLDEGNGLYALSGFLNYTHFDPRPFPNLLARLEAQGIERPPAAEIPFACGH